MRISPRPCADGMARWAWLRVVAGRSGLGHVVGQLEHFQGAGALFHAAQEAALFQGGDQAVDAGLGFEVQRLLHLVEGGRDAAFAHPLMDEHQEFILLAGQHRQSLPEALGRPG